MEIGGVGGQGPPLDHRHGAYQVEGKYSADLIFALPDDNTSGLSEEGELLVNLLLGLAGLPPRVVRNEASLLVRMLVPMLGVGW